MKQGLTQSYSSMILEMSIFRKSVKYLNPVNQNALSHRKIPQTYLYCSRKWSQHTVEFKKKQQITEHHQFNICAQRDSDLSLTKLIFQTCQMTLTPL